MHLRNKWNGIVFELRVDKLVIIVWNVDFGPRNIVIGVLGSNSLDFKIELFLLGILWNYRLNGIGGGNLLS